MSLEPPPFQEAARCDVCKCSFNTFRRRHHCRCCGRTLCSEHSSNQMALPQFGLHSCVRVCADCFNNSSQSGKDDHPQNPLQGANLVIDSVSKLDIGGANVDLKTEPTAAEHHSALGISECKCGMPLCICEAPAPAPRGDVLPLPKKTTSTFTAPKKTDTAPKSNRGSASNSNKPQMDYEVNGDGLREAIKNSDVAAVKKLLTEGGVDANYRDKQGMSLLHLAAVFNQTDIAFILMDYGASLECRNAQGETPLDCAPATLQFKMQKKMEEKDKSLTCMKD